MSVTFKSDKELIELTQVMIDDVVKASNQRNWDLFSKYQTEEEANDPTNRESVEKQWAEFSFLTSLNLNRDILGVLRRDETALVIWKQTSTEVPGEYLASYHVKEIGKEIKEVGFQII